MGLSVGVIHLVLTPVGGNGSYKGVRMRTRGRGLAHQSTYAK